MDRNRQSVWRDIRDQARQELLGNLIPFWSQTAAPRRGRHSVASDFPGLITNGNRVDFAAPRGLVMYARILWSFAAFSRIVPDPALKRLAAGALRGLQDIFHDRTYGGYHWLSDGENRIVDRRKVVYGQAFALYALSETVLADIPDGSVGAQVFTVEAVRALADKLFGFLEEYARDSEKGGYYEILRENWERDPSGVLSDQDIPCFKSMNTNLHILEAYTNYHRMRADEESGNALESLVLWFIDTIYDEDRGHLKLFLNERGESLMDADSYGHDIEASWLIQEAAEVIGKKELLNQVRPVVVKLGETLLREGFSLSDGGLDNEWRDYSAGTAHRDTDRIWWVQAEALVGFRNLYELTGDEKWTDRARKLWNYVMGNLKDREYGEWFWAVDRQGNPDRAREKAGLWKTPYHNGRCTLELMSRIKE